jgi:hypothetical protein
MSYTFGGYLHIFAGITLAVIAIQFIRRRNDLVRLKRRYKGEFRLLSDPGHRAGNAVSKRIEILAQERVVAAAKG